MIEVIIVWTLIWLQGFFFGWGLSLYYCKNGRHDEAEGG